MPYLQTALVPSGLYLIFSFTEKWGDSSDLCAKKRTPDHPSAPHPLVLSCDRCPRLLSLGGSQSEEDAPNHLLPTPVSNLIFSCSQQGGYCKYINYRQSRLIRSLLSEGVETVKPETLTDPGLPEGHPAP